MKSKLKFLIAVFFIVFSTCLTSQSYPTWMTDINATDCIYISQGERTGLIIADLGFVADIERIFKDRIYYFNAEDKSLYKEFQSSYAPSKSSLISLFFIGGFIEIVTFYFLGPWKAAFALAPIAYLFYYPRYEAQDHATEVASLSAGRCTEIDDYNSGKKERLCGLARQANIISISNTDVISLGLIPSLIDTVKFSMSIDYKTIDVYDKSGNPINILKNLSPLKIINLSLGSGNNPEIARVSKFQNWDKLANQSVLMVIAAGNSGKNMTKEELKNEFPHLLHEQDYVMLVGGLAKHGKDLKKSSNYNKDFVLIAAPGEDLIALNRFGREENVSGTSFAAPLVSATAALIASCNRTLSSEEIRAIIIETADVVPDLKDKVQDGRKLNVCRAVEKACHIPGDEDPDSKKPKSIQAGHEFDLGNSSGQCFISDFFKEVLLSQNTCPAPPS